MPRGRFVLCCPGCRSIKEAEWMIGTRGYSARSFDLPYFMCGRCRLICLNKTVLLEAIRDYRNLMIPGALKHIPSQKETYRMMLKVLERTVEYYCQSAGYRRARFTRVRS